MYTSEFIAHMAHEVNKIWCRLNGDLSQPDWEHAPDWQKQSAINGVNFHISNPNAKPEDSHINWLKEKEADGWKYGTVKNPETKEHPCFVPYNELPLNQRVKDALFISVVHSLLQE